MDNSNNGNQITDQVSKTTVQFRDKITHEYLHTEEIANAKLAKLYHDQLVSHAINGVPVVDI